MFKWKKIVVLVMSLSLLISPSAIQHSDNVAYAASESDVNLIENSGFESSTGTAAVADKWVAATPNTGASTFKVTESEDAAGKRVQRVTVSGMKAVNYASVYQLISVESDKGFNVNAQFNVAQLDSAVIQLYVDFFKDGQYLASNVSELKAVTRGSFVTLAGYGRTPQGANKAYVHAMGRATADNGAVDFYVDSVQFTYDEGPNLVSNASYEEVTAEKKPSDGWKLEKSSADAVTFDLVTDKPTSGAKEQKVTVNGINNWGFGGISQIVAVQPGTPFNVNGRFRAQDLVNAKVQLYVDFYNNGGYIATTATELPSNTNLPVTLAAVGTVPAGAIYAKIYLILRGVGGDGVKGSGTFYADAIHFSYNNEPNHLLNPGLEFSTKKTGEPDGWDIYLIPGSDVQPSSTLAQAEGKTKSFYNPAGWLLKTLTRKNGIQYTTDFKYDANGNQVSRKPSSQPYNSNVIHEGREAAYLTAHGIKQYEANGISQYLKVEPGLPFTFNAKLNVESLNKATVQVYIDFADASGKFIAANVKEYNNAATVGQFVDVAATGAVPANAVFARAYVLLRAADNNASGSVYVDTLRWKYN